MLTAMSDHSVLGSVTLVASKAGAEFLAEREVADVLAATCRAEPGSDVTEVDGAAFVAGALGSRHLVLVKPCEEGENLVDHCFAAVLPAGLSCITIAWDRIEELPARLANGAR